MDVWRKSSFSGDDNYVEITWHKSSHSSQGDCVEVGWRKSTHSDGMNCVEVNADDSTVLVRNSQHPDRGTLTFSATAMRSWIEGIKAEEFGG